jgi:TPP-dependent pyruvate/acetoin dehydrogenase alpha subunit
LDQGWQSSEQLQALEAQIEAQVSAAVDLALRSPDPDPAEALRYVYAD